MKQNWTSVRKNEQHENKWFYLNKYIETLKEPLQNKVKKIGELKSRSGSNKNKNIAYSRRVNQALWFAQSFGLEFTGMKVIDKHGKSYDLIDKSRSASISCGCLPET